MLATKLVSDESFEWSVESAPELSDLQFRQWAELLEAKTGITLAPQRRQFLLSNLRMRMRELGIASCEEYYQYIGADRRGRLEWLKLVDRLTVHETRFKRHPASFRLIEERFLPSYTSRAKPLRSLQAWSVGCATGEEAYTLAMVLAHYIGEQRLDAYYSVMATDISRDSLAFARAGRYPAQRLVNLDEAEIEAGFEQADGDYQVRDEIRRRVCFTEQNVMELARAPFGPMDIIFCQNLLIYFAQEQRKSIIQALVDFLKPGGLLVLGIGEMVTWQHASLQRVEFEDTLAYQKVKDLGHGLYADG